LVKNHPGPLGVQSFNCGIGRCYRSLGASHRINKRSTDCDRADYTQRNLKARKPEHDLGRFRHALLGGEIILRALFFTSLGVLFAVPGAWGLVLILDRKRRWDWLRGLTLIALSVPVTGSFYSWAAYGHPLWVWRAYTGW
jgi:hypothetical protein